MKSLSYLGVYICIERKYAIKHFIYDDFSHSDPHPHPVKNEERKKKTYLGGVIQVYVYIEFVLVQSGLQTKNDKYFN